MRRRRSTAGFSIGLPTRRQLLGWSGLGISLPRLWQARAAAAARSVSVSQEAKIKACIIVFYYGGPSHLDTYDMKPAAPAEIRGEFQSIATTVPGLRIGEHLPKTARIMHKVALVRSLHHPNRNHDSACTETFTGRGPVGGDKENFAKVSELQVFPSVGASLSYVRRSGAHKLAHVTLPFLIHNVVTVPGQQGGFLGAAFHPFLVEGDPNTLTYHADLLKLPSNLTPERLGSRRAMLQALEDGGAPARTQASAAPLHLFRDKALDLLESEAVRQALDVTQEPLAVRERYGLGPKSQSFEDGPNGGNGAELGIARNLRGQNLLLARRLVEAGVPVVNINDYKQQGKNWDSHAQNFSQLKDHLLPPADQAFAALIDDLDQRGLLETTLVIALGEFGRTPRINKNAGRDHWPDCYCALLAGGRHPGRRGPRLQ